MRKEELFESIAELDEDLLKRSEERRQNFSWLRWAGMAACLVALCWVGISVGNSDSVTVDDDTPVVDDSQRATVYNNTEDSVDTAVAEQEAVGFIMNGAIYSPISFDDYIRFGLIPEGTMGLTGENTYRISKDDLGEIMGTVELPINEEPVGVTVYHFSKFPDYDAICIVELAPDNYQFYVSDGLQLSDEIGQNSDRILEAYNMPEAVTKVTVQTGEWETVLTITDTETIAAICELMSGKENIGLPAHEKLFADLWFETYGNEDVYYDESDGIMHYRSTDLYEKAHELWGAGERVVWFTTERGFEFYMIYKPAIATFSLHGYYCMEESEVARMNELLEIGEAWMEAVQSDDLTKDASEFFGGSYIDDNGSFVVVLTEDTAENRARICEEFGISESNTIFRTGTYTLAYLTELQAKISNAMINKELPFVVSSGVYETINKIKVGATTNDEAELAKVYALDTIGGAIEVEYISENDMVREDVLINDLLQAK